eukprot:CAMPEP_0201540846 /NCGR_PEP_ID=MMETSP0161_2-20130828/71162_1 /ASSEMBLY_ACC=CAM_ASM_000251 /TAXON_ID=180227 /ORGANISM="Neoparamoeba aestuarina, Strain SoJaBio B1-5/56/2" /LENGTH=144 /DNA_ID=CAMNT_0047948343 /DNA_START=244 /DNA_END=678 /DNA_ORIENTATION=-
MTAIFQANKDLCVFLVEVGAIAGLYAYGKICDSRWDFITEGESFDANEPVNYYGVTRRFTSDQAKILENYFQSGISTPTEEEANDILNQVGRHGEYGLLISKNMIFVWFKQRSGLPKEVKFDFEEDKKPLTPRKMEEEKLIEAS